MGAATSKAKIDVGQIVNESITSTILNSSKTCAANTTNVQELSITDINAVGCMLKISGVTQNATVTTNLSCAADSANAQSMQAAFSSNLKTSVDSAMKDLAIGTTSESDVTLAGAINTVTNNTNITDIATCVASTVNAQKLTLGRYTIDCTKMTSEQIAAGRDIISIDNIAQTFIGQTVANCTANSASTTTAVTNLQATVDAAAKSSNSGFNPIASLANLFSSLTWPWITGLIGVAVVSIIFIIAFLIWALSPAGQDSSREASKALIAALTKNPALLLA